MKTIQYLLLSLAALALSLGCKKKCHDPCKPECENYDPCCGRMPADARFTIYEELPFFFGSSSKFEQNLTPTDTVVRRNFVVFRAHYDASYYQWKIGSDEREWNTKEVRLRFSSVEFYRPVNITLKVYKPTDKSCFPNSNDTVVFSRTLYTVPEDSSLLINRTFKGFTKSEPDVEKIFRYAQGPSDPFISGTLDTLLPILPNCEMISYHHDRYFGYKSVVFRSSSGLPCCFAPSFSGQLRSTNHLWIRISHGEKEPTEDDPCKVKWPSERIYDEFNSYF